MTYALGMGTYTLSLPQLAAVMGISPSHAYQLAASDELPIRVIRLGRRMVVARRDVEEILGALDVTSSPAGDAA